MKVIRGGFGMRYFAVSPHVATVDSDQGVAGTCVGSSHVCCAISSFRTLPPGEFVPQLGHIEFRQAIDSIAQDRVTPTRCFLLLKSFGREQLR